ncbi:hypothetical protein BT96DRAFT_1002748 [Gymnopus androsaceus JB14]|uniref:Uncharacterized protein n=1 Tax=Gymnopus androsaceus JB14 TaxID=1447944 RepID=A0A6A4GVU1_9AGAR|nr:hypothetical protein BT96DRAFT_1002748 [Gymnopus androsaceus JB14]
MTPDESALLSQIGTVIYYGIVVLIVDCTLYGFYLLAEFIALYLFFKHGLKQRMQKILFICSTTTLLTASWDFVSLMEPLEAGLQAQADAAQHAILPWFSMMAWPININIIIGNGIVIWRAWAVWQNDRSVRSALITMFWVNFGMCISNAVLQTVIRSKGVKEWKRRPRDSPDVHLFGCEHRCYGPHLVESQSLLLLEAIVVHISNGCGQLLYAIFGRMNITAAQFSPVNIAWSIIAVMFNAITILYAMAVIIMHIINRSALNKLFGLKTIINVSTSEKNGQTTRISTLRFAEGGGRQVTSSTGLGSADLEGQEDSSGIVEHVFKGQEKSQTEAIVQ